MSGKITTALGALGSAWVISSNGRLWLTFWIKTRASSAAVRSHSLLARILYRPYTWLCEGLEASAQLGFDGTPPPPRAD